MSFEDCWDRDGLGVDHGVENVLASSIVVEDSGKCGVLVLVVLLYEVVDTVQALGRRVTRRFAEHATAEDPPIVFESFDFETGDDTEVAAAAFESHEQVAVVVHVGVDDLTRCENDFEVEHVVRDKANFCRVEGYATTKCQSTNTSGAAPPTRK